MKVFTNRLKYILRHRHLFKIITIFLIIIIIIFTSSYKNKSILNENDTSFKGIVYKKKISDKDKTYFDKAELLLYTECGLALNMTFEDTKNYIIKQIEIQNSKKEIK